MRAELLKRRGPRHGLAAALQVLACAVLLSGMAPPAVADGKDNDQPDVAPPHSRPDGASYNTWATRWWQWAFSIPANINPLLDDTGQNADVGQSGDVWFLAGTWGNGTVDRKVAIPADKALFFPVINSVYVNTPAYGDNPWSEDQENFLRAYNAAAIDGATDVACQVDGQAVKHLDHYRFATPDDREYMVDMPDNNLFGIDPGTYGPTEDDGYYLMLAPLSPGEHTIHFIGALASGFALDVTYHITVKDDHRDKGKH
ncbi:MAG: hypothetical protein ACHRHE_18185 [Tepidisphaerales bacterium]